MSTLEFPTRYEALARLGQGGGGEVWAVRDAITGARLALKVLSADASEREMAALVREAAALSGLEGLGVPRVLRFGRLPRTRRPYMVRELVEGRGLDRLIQEGTRLASVLSALTSAADQLTVLHRAGLLHGDVKPANVIVQPDGAATFVDLGLAAPLREGGALAEGLTPRYAAPELLHGKPLTVRAEVYALGVALAEALEALRTTSLSPEVLGELSAIAARATAAVPAQRFPSVDELASAVRRAAGLPMPAADADHDVALWPVVGIDAFAGQLLEAAHALAPGALLRVAGPPGSGRTALLRRLAWSLGAEGEPVASIEEQATAAFVASELNVYASLKSVFLLVDDADALEPAVLAEVRRALAEGARVIAMGGAELGPAARELTVPPLEEHAARELVRRAIPSLGDEQLRRVLELSGRRPGELRRMVRLIASDPMASTADVERALGAGASAARVPEAPLERAVHYLDRGRYNDARAALGALPAGESGTVAVAIAHARLELGLGEAAAALTRLTPLSDRALAPEERAEVSLYIGRAHLGVGDYARALALLAPLTQTEGSIGIEALSFHALGLSLLGKHDEALAALERACSRASEDGVPRVEAVALVSLALALQRADRNDEARAAYERAIAAAERASDAGALATIRTNLAGLLKIRGDIAGAIEQFEAGLDMGRRSGRRQTARQALLNLANLDLYLGRLSRAEARIAALEEQRAQLPAVLCAQLEGLSAELLARKGNLEESVLRYEASARGYEALGRASDAAEARLEGVLAEVRLPHPDVTALRARIELSASALGEAPKHRPLLLLAKSRVASIAGDDVEARARIDEALAAARDAGQREWLWRALEARAELEEAGGQVILARRDREEALAVLEEIGARLPRDLREVYWNDPRRAQVRASVTGALGTAATEFLPLAPGLVTSGTSRTGTTLVGRSQTLGTQSTVTPLERRLARILEVNSELAGEVDLTRLTARITDYAVELARAERGILVLRKEDGELTVHTSRARGMEGPAAEFSRSIAETVIASREPVVALNAQNDARMAGFASVHQMMLESVACVPILAPSGRAVGALYVETRLRPGAHFERELPTLRAFADQVAIALENARLIRENQQRADELAEANLRLEEARERLRELLGNRTEQLKRTRTKLRDAREALYGHFGYHGLVGTSAAMRRVYALVDRLKATDVPVLITGESGTGKEMVARAIHAASPRAGKKMLGVNCGAIPENLLESELFGHVRGAFTGADRERKGLFRECDGGTILLDEIGETPAKMQAGLLRVLQDGKVRPVGGTEEQSVDVRLLFATNRDLSEMVGSGTFREDLYYRIHVVEVRMPALRERAEDIPQLVDHFLGLFAARYKRDKKSVSREALRTLALYDWPGNVRQLEHVLLNAWIMSEGDELVPEDFDLPGARGPGASVAARSRVESEQPPRAGDGRRPKRRGTISEHHQSERERILEALRACNWNRVKAAELSGIPRRTFYRRLKEYGIQ
ncbi:MAG TPA: sigma 54-interacting transcriptional regulator [Polyangiaceae bacterium]|nr:sigma 54-interacting transcriptional regulator [Polyangiaceae bacterium]